MRNHRFSTEILYIVCGRLATQHARCHKEYYSPRGQAVSTSHFLDTLGGRFASAKRIRQFWCENSQEKSIFHEISASEHATGAPMQTLTSLRIFPQPMDRAEVLHAPSYDLSGRRKNTPGENDQVLS